jgi:hypothetical protein
MGTSWFLGKFSVGTPPVIKSFVSGIQKDIDISIVNRGDGLETH